MKDLDRRVREAIRHYWYTRSDQAKDQARRGQSDQGARSAVTGGKQMDGFVELVRDILLDCGISEQEISYRSRLELPGYYRPTKQWDILVVADGKLVAAVEFKSLGSSFGNNLNNRVEESLGSATDLWTAYREGAIPLTPRPWLGYLLLLVECEASTHPVGVSEPHFEVLAEFKGASYLERGRILLSKLMRERLYEATCFLTTPQNGGETGDYDEPDDDLAFRYLAESLRAHVAAFQSVRSAEGTNP